MRADFRRIATAQPAQFARRLMRNPFVRGVARPRLVHFGHHRAGSTWLASVLRAVATRYGLRMQDRKDLLVDPEADVVFHGSFQHHLRGPFDARRQVRGSHMVRDPRDMVVSAYHYHRWTKEKWAHVPRQEFGGLSYQEYLRSLDTEEGIAAEIRRSTRTVFVDMYTWQYGRPEFLELRYEDLIAAESSWFARLFGSYGFNEQAVLHATSIAEQFSFGSSGRELGQVRERDHRRSGMPGQWRESFGSGHVALFKELTGDLLIKLGYEADNLW